MSKEFNLSLNEFPEGYFPKDKVKEAVRLLKEETSIEYPCPNPNKTVSEIINKVFGDKLTK